MPCRSRCLMPGQALAGKRAAYTVGWRTSISASITCGTTRAKPQARQGRGAQELCTAPGAPQGMQAMMPRRTDRSRSYVGPGGRAAVCANSSRRTRLARVRAAVHTTPLHRQRPHPAPATAPPIAPLVRALPAQRHPRWRHYCLLQLGDKQLSISPGWRHRAGRPGTPQGSRRQSAWCAHACAWGATAARAGGERGCCCGDAARRLPLTGRALRRKGAGLPGRRGWRHGEGE